MQMLGGALPYVQEIAPYQAGKPIDTLAREMGLDPRRIVKLASNENPLGMPASARAAVQALLDENELARYPDSHGFELRAGLAQHLDVPPEWLVLGNGSNDVLELAAAAYLAPGRSCVYSQFAFAVYPLATQARGARALVVPAKDHGHDLEAMAAAIEGDTTLIYVANPNNPTGTYVDQDAVDAFLARVPQRVAVVLDEAYFEYLPAQRRVDTMAWVRRYPNVLVTRTFSKAYGLAGLRVGYGVAQPAMIHMLDRVRQPFNVNAVALAAATAALGDAAFIADSVRVNAFGMAQLTAAFDRLSLRYLPSAGNFLLVHLGPRAQAVNQGLLARGVIVRPVGNYGLPEWLRISIGLERENARCIEALEEVLKVL